MARPEKLIKPINAPFDAVARALLQPKAKPKPLPSNAFASKPKK